MSNTIPPARIRHCPSCGADRPRHVEHGEMECRACGERFRVIEPGEKNGAATGSPFSA